MKRKEITALLLAVTVTAGTVLGLTGCGASETVSTSETTATSDTAETDETTETEETADAPETATESDESEAESNGEVKVYRIATEGAYAPYNYLDAEGNPDGYDIAVAKAVDELIPEVEFEYQAVQWDAIFTGLEAGNYDIIVSQAAKNPDREAKYLFGDTAYTWGIGAIAVKSGTEGIHSLEDLKGKTVTVAVGSSNANVIETWNAEHDNAINVTYGDGDVSKALLDVQEGRVDATLVMPVTAQLVVNEQGLDVEFVLRNDDTVNPVYWLYSRTEENEELKPLVDEALQTLIDNGTLAEISEEYLGADYSTKEAVEARITQ